MTEGEVARRSIETRNDDSRTNTKYGLEFAWERRKERERERERDVRRLMVNGSADAQQTQVTTGRVG